MCNSANGEPHSPGLLRDRGRGDRGGPGSPRGTALQEGTVWGLHDQHPRRMPGVSRVSRGLRLCRRAHGTPGGHPAFLCGPEEATNDPGDGRPVPLPGLHSGPVSGATSPSLASEDASDEGRGGLCPEGSRRGVLSDSHGLERPESKRGSWPVPSHDSPRPEAKASALRGTADLH